MNAVLLDWRPKRTAHVRVATASKYTWECWLIMFTFRIRVCVGKQYRPVYTIIMAKLRWVRILHKYPLQQQYIQTSPLIQRYWELETSCHADALIILLFRFFRLSCSCLWMECRPFKRWSYYSPGRWYISCAVILFSSSVILWSIKYLRASCALGHVMSTFFESILSDVSRVTTPKAPRVKRTGVSK